MLNYRFTQKLKEIVNLIILRYIVTDIMPKCIGILQLKIVQNGAGEK